MCPNHEKNIGCYILSYYYRVLGARGRRSWLRHCATSRKVVGSIPDGVIGIFHCHNPSGRTMTLGLTQPLTEMSIRNISWVVKAPGALGWHYYLHVPIVLKSGSLNLLEPSGPVQACNGVALPLLQGSDSSFKVYVEAWLNSTFLGAFAKLGKATISFVSQSVCPHRTTRLPMEGFSWNFIFEYFSKVCRENLSFI